MLSKKSSQWIQQAVQERHIEFIPYDSFTKHEEIARGAYGEVTKAYWPTAEKTVALKSLFDNYDSEAVDDKGFDDFVKEFKLIRSVHFHDNVIRVFGISQVKSGEREKPVDGTPDDYRKLYEKAWSQNPKDRPDINEVKEKLEEMLGEGKKGDNSIGSLTNNMNALNTALPKSPSLPKIPFNQPNNNANKRFSQNNVPPTYQPGGFNPNFGYNGRSNTEPNLMQNYTPQPIYQPMTSYANNNVIPQRPLIPQYTMNEAHNINMNQGMVAAVQQQQFPNNASNVKYSSGMNNHFQQQPLYPTVNAGQSQTYPNINQHLMPNNFNNNQQQFKQIVHPPSNMNAQPMTPSNMNAQPMTPSNMNVQSMTPSNMNVQSMTPSNMNVQSMTPSNMNVQSMTPSYKPIKPSNMNAQPTIPSNMNAQPMIPSNMNAQPMIPSNMNVQSMTPTNMNAQPMPPSNMNAQPMAPSNMNAQSMAPSNMNAQSMAPSNMNAQPMTPSNMNAQLMTPSNMSAQPVINVSTINTPPPFLPSVPNSGYSNNNTTSNLNHQVLGSNFNQQVIGNNQFPGSNYNQQVPGNNFNHHSFTGCAQILEKYAVSYKTVKPAKCHAGYHAGLGDIEGLKYHLSCGESITSTYEFNDTADYLCIIVAKFCSDIKMVEEIFNLLRYPYGPLNDPNNLSWISVKNNRTVLHYLTTNKNLTSDIDVSKEKKKTADADEVSEGQRKMDRFHHHIKKVIEFLVVNGCDINTKDEKGYTVLSLYLTKTAFQAGFTRVIEILLNNGADPNVSITIKSRSLSKGSSAKFEIPNMTSNNGSTNNPGAAEGYITFPNMLFLAIWYRWPTRILNLLKEHKVDIDKEYENLDNLGNLLKMCLQKSKNGKNNQVSYIDGLKWVLNNVPNVCTSENLIAVKKLTEKDSEERKVIKEKIGKKKWKLF
ncbi:97_t:CDS:2 [Cetraspora pellucida]|uniref:97_t:CDS:1 n=1 Tax=Cetraspora pellucida TaxID=1433469 RepID=A0A9N9FTM3_9GLOM|nr:97_t:CDS:2 [Cetraspora pellucida]